MRDGKNVSDDKNHELVDDIHIHILKKLATRSSYALNVNHLKILNHNDDDDDDDDNKVDTFFLFFFTFVLNVLVLLFLFSHGRETVLMVYTAFV